MKVIYGTGGLKAGAQRRTAVAIGVFDGVHRGHQKILRRLVRDARQRGWRSAVVTFACHPSCVVNPSQGVPHLTSLSHKLNFLSRAGVDLCYVIDFNKHFARMRAESFVRRILVGKIGAAAIYVGEDFVFGCHREGDKGSLAAWSQKYGFSLFVLPHLKIAGRIVSSTLIRSLVRRGRLKAARRLLGRAVSVQGQVVHGEGRGHRLGYPTANIRPHHEVIAPDGVYAARVAIGRRVLPAAAYIGVKPTFHPRDSIRSVEVFIFGIHRRLYGRLIEIQFLRRLRADKKFSSRAALVAQIQKDIRLARSVSG